MKEVKNQFISRTLVHEEDYKTIPEFYAVYDAENMATVSFHGERWRGVTDAELLVILIDRTEHRLFNNAGNDELEMALHYLGKAIEFI